MDQDLSLHRRLASIRDAAAPIQSYLDDDDVIEVMLNADGRVWVEAVGRGMFRTDVTLSVDISMRLLRLVAAAMNVELMERNPELSGKLPIWGARIQASIPPIVEAPTFALRKPAKRIFTLAEYVRAGIVPEKQADAIQRAVVDRSNIIVSGSTGSGKTTLLNALLAVLATSTRDRLYIVQDTLELQCLAPNKVEKLVIPEVYSYQRAIMDGLRYRPDRILVGEARDGAAMLELLKSWNTGHPGGMCSLHANSTRAALDRICQLLEEVMPSAPRELVADAVDVCVHIEHDPRHPAGRRVSGVDRVLGYKGGWLLEPLAA